MIAVDAKEYYELVARHNSLFELFISLILQQPHKRIRIEPVLFLPDKYEMVRVAEMDTTAVWYSVQEKTQVPLVLAAPDAKGDSDGK
jgi:hypothetical protein